MKILKVQTQCVSMLSMDFIRGIFSSLTLTVLIQCVFNPLNALNKKIVICLDLLRKLLVLEFTSTINKLELEP